MPEIKIQKVEAPKELTTETNSMLVWAQGLVVTTPEEDSAANERLKVVKAISKRVTEFFKPMKQQADAAKKAILDAEKELATPLSRAEQIAKKVLLDYRMAEERKRQEEQRRLQAEADERARKESERLRKQAEKLKTPELKEERLAQAEQVAAPVVQVQSTVQAAGSSIRKTWKAELVSMDELISAAAAGSDLARTCLSFNESAANKLATATKGAVNCPGIKWKEEASLSTRIR
jgi:DNA primase large subunit